MANQAKIARDALLEAELDHERTRSARDFELGGLRARLEREGGPGSEDSTRRRLDLDGSGARGAESWAKLRVGRSADASMDEANWDLSRANERWRYLSAGRSPNLASVVAQAIAAREGEKGRLKKGGGGGGLEDSDVTELQRLEWAWEAMVDATGVAAEDEVIARIQGENHPPLQRVDAECV